MKTKFLRSIIGLVTLLCLLFVSGCQTLATVKNVLVPGAAQENFEFTQAKVCSDEDQQQIDLYYHFVKNATNTGLIIPALEQYFVPQGLAYWPEMDWFVVSGYFNPTDYSTASALVCVEATTGKYVGEFTVRDRDGEFYTDHFGGVAITEKNIYLTAGGTLARIPLSTLKSAKGKGALKVAEEIPVPVGTSFCNYANGILWVGEFYHKTAYPREHMYRNNDGDLHYAWALGYKVDQKQKSGIEREPSYVLSIPEKIQGFTVAEDGRIFLTQSYGRTADSTLMICKNPLDKAPDQMVTIHDKEVPMWFLDNANGLQKMTSLPMAEGCCAIGQDMYLIYESGAHCYSDSVNPTDAIWKCTLP